MFTFNPSLSLSCIPRDIISVELGTFFALFPADVEVWNCIPRPCATFHQRFSFAFSKDRPHVVCRLLVLFGISYQMLLPNPRRALAGPHLQLIESSWSTKAWFTASRIQGLVAAGLQQEKEVVYHLVCISLTIVYSICGSYNNFKSLTEGFMVFGITRRKYFRMGKLNVSEAFFFFFPGVPGKLQQRVYKPRWYNLETCFYLYILSFLSSG